MSDFFRKLKRYYVFISLLSMPGCTELGFLGSRNSSLDLYSEYFIDSDTNPPINGSVLATYLGATTLLLDDGETRLLIDAFISRPSFWNVAFGKVDTNASRVDAALLSEIDKIDGIFVSHSHYDHALDAVYIAKKTGAHLFGSHSTRNVGLGGELPGDLITVFSPGESVGLGRFSVTAVASSHSPPIPLINDDLGECIKTPLVSPARYSAYAEGGSMDFLVEHDGRSILVKASTNFDHDLPSNLDVDVLFLSTAMLGSQSNGFKNSYYNKVVSNTMPERVIPVHWDNFFHSLDVPLRPLGSRSFRKAFDFLGARLRQDGTGFHIMRGGDSMMVLDAIAVDSPP